jgi:hypothetical protein
VPEVANKDSKEITISTVETIAQVGVGFIGGITAGFLGPHMNQAKDRQIARSAAAEKIADLEGALWSTGTYADFRKAVGSFRAAAIGAKIPKLWVDAYVELCKGLYGMIRQGHPPEMPEIEHKNVLDALDYRASEYADALMTIMWHPYRSRTYALLLRRSTARTVDHARTVLADDYGYTDPLMRKTIRAWERRFAASESACPSES